MGICPCQRDRAKDCGSLERLHSASGSNCQSDTALAGFRTDEVLIREVDPLASAYLLLAPLEANALVRAEFADSHTPCVIRVLPKHKGQSPVREQTLKSMLQLDHETALKVYEVCQDASNLYIVMESFDGGELGDYLAEQGYLQEKTAAHILSQVLTFLAHCHQLAIAHRDLDLQCIVFKEEPNEDTSSVKVMGLENFEIRGAESAPTCFTAPEVVAGAASEKADVWSCGVLLYILLSGRNPFENYECSSVLMKLKTKGFSFPPAIWGHVSQEAIDLILLTMNSRPEARPSAKQCLAHPWIRHFSRLRTLLAHTANTHIDLWACETSIKKSVLYFMINRVIDEAELAKLSAKFTELDRDGDGFITQSELLAYFGETMSLEQAISETRKIMLRLESNTHGFIDYSEFLLASFPSEILLSHKHLKTTFDALDRDCSGKISATELRSFFRIQSAESLSKWQEMTQEVRCSEDGELDFSEFEALMTKALED